MRVPRRTGDYKLHQWANDWISADGPEGQPVIVNPVGIELESDEVARLFADHERYLAGDRGSGFFWDRYELDSVNSTIRRRT